MGANGAGAHGDGGLDLRTAVTLLPTPAAQEPGGTVTQYRTGWVTDVPGITRNEALKALGNGVVPQQAAAALRVLAANLSPTHIDPAVVAGGSEQ